MSHNPTILCNIYTGEESDDKANPHKSVEIGTEQMIQFQHSLPEGFRNTISNVICTMKKGKQQKKEIVELYNSELLFSRVMYLLSINQIEVDNLFDYKLSPIPTSLFNDDGEARYPKNKADLKLDLKVEVSTRNVVADAVFIDGCAMLHAAIYWPKGGTVQDLLNGVRNYIQKFLDDVDVYLLFDKYRQFSIKSDTRAERLGRIRRAFTLSAGSPLPSKDVTMKTTATKVQLIALIANDLLSFFLSSKRKIVITANEEYPEESHLGVCKMREDMRTSHEEADVMIPQQIAVVSASGSTCLKVICEDTDVFVLLCHFYLEENWTHSLYMESFSPDKSLPGLHQIVCGTQQRNRALHFIGSCFWL